MLHDRPITFDSQLEEWAYAILTDFRDRNYISGFLYQWPVLGYYDLRGAIILDFLVFNPFETAVQLHGNYWHSGEMGSNDKYQDAILKQMYPVVVTFWGNEMETYEMTEDLFRKWLVVNAGTSKE